MKRLALFFAALMILSFGLASADVLQPTISGTWGPAPGKVDPGTKVTWTIHMTVTTNNVEGLSNGFEVYISTDANGATIVPSAPGSFGAIDSNVTYSGVQAVRKLVDFSTTLDGGFFINQFTPNGGGADTVGFGGFALFKTGLPVGYDADVYEISTMVLDDATYDVSVNGGTQYYLCIDSSFYPPGGSWLWALPASGSAFPDPGPLPLCNAIENQPDVPAEFTNCPGVQQQAGHCATFTYDFDATDVETPANALTFEMVSGPGSIAPATGIYSYSPSAADVGSPIAVEVGVRDGANNLTVCAFDMFFTNNAPVLTCPGDKVVGQGNDIVAQASATDADACDSKTFSIAVNPALPGGAVSIDPNTGAILIETEVGDFGLYDVTVTVDDQNATDECTFELEVLSVEPFEVVIEKTHGTLQGGHEFVDVTVTKGSEQLWGFDILIAYDASALSFQMATPGDIYDDCGWEYFTYRYGAAGNCSGGCPSGLLRVIGIAETNNGANHPDCYTTTMPFTLFSLDFLVTDDRTFECMYAPIRFFWLDCGDNTFSYHENASTIPGSQILGVSRFVWDGGFDAEFVTEISNGTVGFPTYLGAQDVCLEGDKDVPVRFVDFYNGGIDIVCADSIDARGDLNLNGLGYEISDAVLFSNYFIYGIGVFGAYYQGAAAASDVNADGLPLSVGDLVYLIRVVVGDALPYPKLAPVVASVTMNDGVISVDERMGAAYVVVEGQVTPTLLAEGVELKYAYDANDNVTRVLVVGMEKDASFQGSFLNAGGNVVSIDMATYEGAPVAAKIVPANFVLDQNYPNPFNPSTTISFGLPTASDYTVTIYNVTGQVVETINGRSEAGTVKVSFDASDLSSGIYFYNVAAGSNSATKKMVLVK